jgi:hypothetical protein
VAAYQHFGLRHDPFTTLSIQPHNLSYFIGREQEVDRVAASLFGLHNVGLAGIPGSGKSSLLQAVRSRVPKQYASLVIGSPKDDPAYFLNELVREWLPVLPVKRIGFSKNWGKQLQAERPDKNVLVSMVKRLAKVSAKPVLVFADDLEKIQGDRVAHWTRSERTLQVLEELKPVLEIPNIAFAVSLQEEFYGMVRDVVREGADPTVLGLFKTVVGLDPFSQENLRLMAETRLQAAGYREGTTEFFEPEAFRLALSLSHGNPRRFLFFLSESCDRAFLKRRSRVEFLDLFEAVNEHLRLDAVCRKLLFFLAKSGRVVATNGDLQAFLGLDAVSLNRRFEILFKNRLVDRLDVSGGSFVYGLPGTGTGTAKPEKQEIDPSLGRSVPFKDEKMYLLDNEPPS